MGQRVAVPRRVLWWLTYGTLAPVLFTAVYLVEGAVRPGYDGWRQSISALSLGPGGWVQQANFAVLGLNTLGVAYVWSRILRGGVGATWYPFMRALESGAEVIVAGRSKRNKSVQVEGLTQQPSPSRAVTRLVAMCKRSHRLGSRSWT